MVPRLIPMGAKTENVLRVASAPGLREGLLAEGALELSMTPD